MLNHIISFFQKLFLNFVSSASPTRFSFEPESLSDDILDDSPRQADSAIQSRAFKLFAKVEEYNHDLMKMFHAHAESFYLDSTQKDGHFRV